MHPRQQHEMDTRISRRSLLAAAGAAALVGPSAMLAGETPPTAGKRRTLRFAHLTDSHTQPERRADQGLIACLKHAQSLSDAPQLIVTGGDLIMDSFEADEARTRTQWDLYTRIFKAECSLPVQHCLGNHDIWGWNQDKSRTTGGEPNYGKRWAVNTLELSGPYYHFDRGGWRFIILDSVTRDGSGYIGRLDDKQFEWLRSQLAETPATTPVLIVSHIPIISASVFYHGKDQDQPNNEWKIGGGLLHVDNQRLIHLFRKHPNVKLCLSGHLHKVDRIDMLGVSYICDGAVSGAWWRGRHVECDEGYGVIDLFDDGTFGHEYVTYGWKADA